MTTLAEYYDMLSRHDWYYAYSDDGSVFRRGEAANQKLAAIAKTSPEHAALLAGYKQYYFSGKPWGTERAPKPGRPK